MKYLFLLLVLTTMPNIGHSSEPTQSERYFFDWGVKYFLNKQYTPALKMFQSSYDIGMHYPVLYDIALCYYYLGDNKKALGYIQIYKVRAISKEFEPQAWDSMEKLEDRIKRGLPPQKFGGP